MEVDYPFDINAKKLKAIYYLSSTPQRSSGSIQWWHNFEIPSDVPLYVLAETYDEIKNGYISPWSYFKDIYIYDAEDDPYLSANTVESDAAGNNLPKEIYNLNGRYVSGSTEGLPRSLHYAFRMQHREDFCKISCLTSHIAQWTFSL